MNLLTCLTFVKQREVFSSIEKHLQLLQKRRDIFENSLLRSSVFIANKSHGRIFCVTFENNNK